MKMNAYFEKWSAVILTASLVLVSVLPAFAFPKVVNAAANYVISGALTVNGLQVDAGGIASANTYTGQGTAQFISISWNFVGNGSTYETLADHNTLIFLNGDKGPNKTINAELLLLINNLIFFFIISSNFDILNLFFYILCF